eukprot:9484909-Pyramimonas_sp.AAC.2
MEREYTHSEAPMADRRSSGSFLGPQGTFPSLYDRRVRMSIGSISARPMPPIRREVEPRGGGFDRRS